MLSKFTRRLLGLAVLAGPLLAHSGVTPDLQHAMREGTFEVVVKKPQHEAVVYEKPLPFELLPYLERTDDYRSVGTAFALGHNTYVTAAHVIEEGIASQFGPPALRRSDGAVFVVERVLKFSEHEDFVVFSVQNDPQPSALAVNRDPKLDQPVLAVGNALGDGVVIRDGLLTSETPEAQDGRWKWIRFSAAASPGNSGGPLCDTDGQVIGIVVRKSPNENLNYALPIGRVLDAAEKAGFDQKFSAGLPFLHGTATTAYRDEFKLPLTWPAFVQEYQALVERHAEESRALVLKTNAITLFPQGKGADDLLYEIPRADARPRLIRQESDGTWTARMPEFDEVNLTGDGSVAVATVGDSSLLRLVRPNAASDDAFYADSRAFMDLALKALDVERYIGPEEVRVISLGAATSETLFTDTYGRKYQQRVWPVPFEDSYLVGQLLPTPDGYVALLMWAPSRELHSVEAESRLMVGQLDVSYEGTLAQWQAAMHRRSLLPSSLATMKFGKLPTWTLQTDRFISSVPGDILALNDRSLMSLVMGFVVEGTRTVWEPQGVWWNLDDRRDSAVGLWRRARPPASAKLELRNGFNGIRSRRPPYDGTFLRETAETMSATRVLDVPGSSLGTVSSDLEYGLTFRMVGFPSLMEADKSLRRLADATHVIEHGIGQDIPATRESTPLDQAFAMLENRLKAETDKASNRIGKDLRGRTIEDDVHDLLQQMKTDAAAVPSSDLSEEREQYFMTETQRASWLGSYWTWYPHLQRNQDMWTDFLLRNQLPPRTPHSSVVTSAEAALRSALAKPPSADWVEREHDLQRAYVKERSDYVKAHSPDKAQLSLRTPRHTPCPPAIAATTGGKLPSYLRSERPLEEMYPVESRRLGEEGTVMVALDISASGCITGRSIVGWSGSDLLDTAVLDWLETVQFTPAEADGHAIATTVVLPIAFNLTDE